MTSEETKRYSSEWYQRNKLKVNAYQAIWRAENREKRKAYCKKYREENKEREAAYKRQYYLTHKEGIIAKQREYKQNNRELVRARDREYCQRGYVREKRLSSYRKWRQANTEKVAGYCAKRRAKVLDASPCWLTKRQLERIEIVYAAAQALTDRGGEAYAVDHILPLQGRKVCGLHVPWNLQILTTEENTSKNNKLPPADQLVDYSAPGYARVQAKLKRRAQ